MDAVEAAPEFAHGVVDQAGVEGVVRGAGGIGERLEPLQHRRALLPDLLPPVLPDAGHALEHPEETRHAGAVGGREVGAAVEGNGVGGEEHGHGPAALARHRLDGVHVDRVDVGALLPVDLDAHEVLVHIGGHGLVLEGLPLHDVAPVAGGVADGQQDRLVLGPRLLKGLRSPGIPVDGVVGVLDQIRAHLVDEAVGLVASGVDLRHVVILTGARN